MFWKNSSPSKIQIYLFLCLILLCFPCLGQVNQLLKDLNHFANPKETKIQIQLKDDRSSESRVVVTHHYYLDSPFKLDTLLVPEQRRLNFSLPLEAPALISVNVDGHSDFLFVVPGQATTVSYQGSADKAVPKREVGPSSTPRSINQYYQERIALFGTAKDPLAAYRLSVHELSESGSVEAYYDSLTVEQQTLLTAYKSKVPDWFVEYESKNLYYTGLSFKLFAAKRQRYKEPKKGNLPETLFQNINDLDLQDEAALLSIFYTESLTDAARLKFCTDECLLSGPSKIVAQCTALLKLGYQIQNEQVRNLFLARNFFLASRSGTPLPPQISQAFVNGLSDAYQLRIKTRPLSLNGQPAPNFYLKDLDGQFYGREAFRDKVVLLNFWFVGCKGCLMEIPYEQQLVQKFAETPFVLLNICTNSEENAWKEWVQKKELSGVNLLAQGNWNDKLAKSYRLTGFPRYVLVDKNGKVVNDNCPRPSSGKLEEVIAGLIK